MCEKVSSCQQCTNLNNIRQATKHQNTNQIHRKVYDIASSLVVVVITMLSIGVRDEKLHQIGFSFTVRLVFFCSFLVEIFSLFVHFSTFGKTSKSTSDTQSTICTTSVLLRNWSNHYCMLKLRFCASTTCYCCRHFLCTIHHQYKRSWWRHHWLLSNKTLEEDFMMKPWKKHLLL